MKKILWLSDIHLNGIKTSDDTKNLIAGFIKKLEEMTDIEVVVISGDVAMSGGNAAHYAKFAELIIEPLKKKLPNAKIISVPGNHDVDWEEAKTRFVTSILNKGSQNNKALEVFKNDIGENFYKKVFQDYRDFHNTYADNISTGTFSNLLKVDDVVFINLNSAWLSVGNPIGNTLYEERKVHKINSYELWYEDKKDDKNVRSLVFQELGNQTYGFTLKQIKPELDRIKNKLETDYKEYTKILVVHHPPNNWLNWNELYTEDNNTKSHFHKFIIDCKVDIILAGHEHTSLTEGGLLYGNTLVLKAGMFLDHHEKDYGHCWFKVLDLDDSGSILERSFNYHQAAGNTWKESEDYTIMYSGWKQVAQRKQQLDPIDAISFSKEITDSSTTNDLKIENDSDLRAIIKSNKSVDLTTDSIFNLLNIVDKGAISILKDGLKKYVARLDNKQSIIYIVDSVDDFFEIVSSATLPKNSYLSTILADLSNENLEKQPEIYVFYTYSVDNEAISNNFDEVKRIVRKKFAHFNNIIFRNNSCIKLLMNAKFAVRLEK